MWDRILQLAAVALVPALGVAARASRRNRQLQRIRAYSQLASDLSNDGDEEGASRIRELRAIAVRHFADAESEALGRRLDPASVATWIVVVLPAAGVAIWAFTWNDWWKWPVIVFLLAWALAFGIVGATQLFKKPEDADPQQNA
jgi:hypothetical protein